MVRLHKKENGFAHDKLTLLVFTVDLLNFYSS